jgi:hypothetical protein
MVEWSWAHSEPHFGSGFPPRYLVPKAELPPPRPLEQLPTGYPDATHDEAPTWIATPAVRAEVLGDWPSAAAGVVARPPEREPDVADLDPADLPDPDSWTVVELPPPVVELPPVVEPLPLPEASEPVVAAEPRPLPASATEVRLARYSFDPLAEPARRRFGRARPGAGPGVDVPAHPYGIRVFPGRRPT